MTCDTARRALQMLPIHHHGRAERTHAESVGEASSNQGRMPPVRLSQSTDGTPRTAVLFVANGWAVRVVFLAPHCLPGSIPGRDFPGGTFRSAGEILLQWPLTRCEGF